MKIRIEADVKLFFRPGWFHWCHISHWLSHFPYLPLLGPLVHWWNLLAWKVADRGFVHWSCIQVSNKQNVPPLLTYLSIVGNLRDRDVHVAHSAQDRQGSNFESYVCSVIASSSGNYLYFLYLVPAVLETINMPCFTWRNVFYVFISRVFLILWFSYQR